MNNILPLFVNQSTDTLSSFLVTEIERRGNFSVRSLRIVPELHIPNDDRCRSNLTDIKQISVNT